MCISDDWGELMGLWELGCGHRTVNSSGKHWSVNGQWVVSIGIGKHESTMRYVAAVSSV